MLWCEDLKIEPVLAVYAGYSMAQEHDTLAQNYFPPLWGNSSYPTVGTEMNNPSYSAVIKLTQTYSPNLLNETAFLYSGNKIQLTPIDGVGGEPFAQPAGWNATSFFPLANNKMSKMPEVQLQGSPINVTCAQLGSKQSVIFRRFHQNLKAVCTLLIKPNALRGRKL